MPRFAKTGWASDAFNSGLEDLASKVLAARVTSGEIKEEVASKRSDREDGCGHGGGASRIG